MVGLAHQGARILSRPYTQESPMAYGTIPASPSGVESEIKAPTATTTLVIDVGLDSTARSINVSRTGFCKVCCTTQNQDHLVSLR